MAIWQDYGNRAIRDLYPLLRDGVDYKWGTREQGTPASLLGDTTGEINPDAVQARANRLMSQDPYADYDPNRPSVKEQPHLNALEPNNCAGGDAEFTLSCVGTNFEDDAVIVWNNGDEPTTFVDTSRVTTTVDPSTITVAISIPVQVRSRGIVSNALAFTITEAAAAPEE